MTNIRKVAIFGASGNFGTPITAALVAAGFQVTIITRIESEATFPDGLPVVKTPYTVDKLTEALADQNAVVCAVGPPGIPLHNIMVDAAEAAGVKRFIIDDFGWGSDFRGLPEFNAIRDSRRAVWDHAAGRAEANEEFTWTGITTGNPIDWALKRFPAMGFDATKNEAIIFDDGTEEFTGTTLEGIGQSVVGVLTHLDETANRFVKVRSIQTCQNALLAAFEKATGSEWKVEHDKVKDLIKRGRAKHRAGDRNWILDLVVGQTFEPGEARAIVVSKEKSGDELLDVREETVDEVVKKVLGM